MPNTMLSPTTAPNTTNYYNATTESDVSSSADSSYADSDVDAPNTNSCCGDSASDTSHELGDSAPQTPDALSELDSGSDVSDDESNESESEFEHGPLSGEMIVHRAFYHAEPYTFIGRAFDELPENAQKFLVKTGLWPVHEEMFEREGFFERLYRIRAARRDRLERTLEGVSRAIAKEMLVRVDSAAAASATHANADSDAEGPASGTATPGTDQSANVVAGLLYPEWQEHLEAYVGEIDALVWVDMRLRLGVEESLSLEGYVREREEDVQRMIEFAVQCLQRTFERVKEERGAAWLVKRIMEGKRQEEGEEIEEIARIEPVSTPLSGAEENAQWVTVAA